jgi:hypothetical protein
MMYAKVIDGAVVAYPYTLAMLKADNPDVSFPRNQANIRIADWNVVAVAEVSRPEPSSINVNVVEGEPALVDGSLTQTWVEVPATADQIAERTREANDEAVRLANKTDAFVQTFIAMTPAEVVDYVETNVTNLATSKTLLKRMAVMMLMLARREYR